MTWLPVFMAACAVAGWIYRLRSPHVERNARVLKEIAAEKDARYRTMNALSRACLRKGAL